MGVAVAKSRHHISALCVDEFATVIPGLIGNLFAKLRDDPVLDDQICVLDALHSVHLRTLKFPHIRRQYACQCSYVVYNSFHGISALKCLIYSVLNVYAC